MTQVAPMTREENNRLVSMALRVFDYDPIDLRDEVQVRARITDYFSECMRLGLRPGNMGLYSALGLSRQQVHNIITRGDRGKISPGSSDMIKKAIRAMSTYRELLGSSGKLNPVTLIFWQKNYDGLQDNSSLELSTNRSADYLEDHLMLTPAEIEAELRKRIPQYSEDPSPEAHPDLVEEIKSEHEAEVQRRIAEDIPLPMDEVDL